MTLSDEINEQPDVVARLLDREGRRIDALGARLRERGPGLVVMAARGSSDHAALYAQYLIGIRSGLPVMLATPSTVTLYGAAARLDHAVVIGVSQSGRSPDIVEVVASARAAGAPTIAITNDPSSPLAEAAAEVIPLHAGEERAIAATKTYTASLAALARLSLALAPSEDPLAARELAEVPSAIRAALATDDQARRVAGWLAGTGDRAVILGRGVEYATAREWTLKLQELAQVFALPFSMADFEHGPWALLEPGLPVLAVVPRGPGHVERLALLRRVREIDARVVAVSDDPEALAIDDGLALSPGTPPWLGPLVSIVPGQLLAVHLARARGRDPEAPRLISKVTLTR